MRMPLLSRAFANSGPVNITIDGGELIIHVVRGSAESIVTLTGRITVDSSPHLRSALLGLLRRGATPVMVIDMSEVTYMDMSGLATLFEALEAARRWLLKLRVVGMTGQTRKFAEVAELDRIFQAAGSEAAYR